MISPATTPVPERFPAPTTPPGRIQAPLVESTSILEAKIAASSVPVTVTQAPRSNCPFEVSNTVVALVVTVRPPIVQLPIFPEGGTCSTEPVNMNVPPVCELHWDACSTSTRCAVITFPARSPLTWTQAPTPNGPRSLTRRVPALTRTV
jgi:hypothetical protein